MRVIKFRGRRTDNQEWVTGDLIQSTENEFAIWPKESETLLGCYEVDPETVGQFTGLVDKNGKEVWEGNILQICNGSINGVLWMEKNREVKFDKGAFNVPAWDFDSTHWFEVIGNIHDNPEMLER